MIAVAAALALLGWLAALLTLYLLLMSFAALLYRPRRSANEPRTRVVILIPAHNEEGQIARCVRSQLDQAYPTELRSVVVIADNCSDRTAAVAREAGAHLVLERSDLAARGKGQALRWAIDQILGDDLNVEAIVVVDADSVADREFLAQLAAEFEAGSQVIQSDNVLYAGDAAGAALRVAAFLLVNRVRQAGRVKLGQTALLLGNGMLFSRELLLSHPWSAFTSTEDLEYTLALQLAGVKVAFAGGAHLRSETAPTPEAAATQQRRWEGGRMHLLRALGPQLVQEAVRRRRPGLLPLAVELAIPPLGLLGGMVAAGGAVALTVAAVEGEGWVFLPWAIAGTALPSYVLVGLRAAHAPRSAYRALAGAPRFILSKPRELAGVLRFRPDSWVRTQRVGETGDQT